jgi:DNA-damage-inducible protein D
MALPKNQYGTLVWYAILWYNIKNERLKGGIMVEEHLEVIKESTFQTLDSFKRKTDAGTDYWLARDLQILLGYTQWRNFEAAIEKAKMACASVGAQPYHHFADISKTMASGKGAERSIRDVALTRYACYLIAMNGDPSKPQIAAAQTYFAVQTRKQELMEQRNEDEDRLMLRDRVRDANKALNSAAKGVGVQNYAFFHDAGYQGLYGGLRLSEIKEVKGINPKEDLLDCAGRAELAANEFRITQTEERLRTQQVKGQKVAEDTHNYVGREIRQTIEKLSGTMPEDLPPAPSIKQLRKGRKPKQLPPSAI